jgi:hypothetical protein
MIARFLYEYHDSSYASLDLPPLEMDSISKLGSNYWLILVLPPIIGYYWQLLAIIAYYFFCKKFSYYWLLLNQAQTLIIPIIVTLLLQLLVPLAIMCIIGNYWQLLTLY